MKPVNAKPNSAINIPGGNSDLSPRKQRWEDSGEDFPSHLLKFLITHFQKGHTSPSKNVAEDNCQLVFADSSIPVKVYERYRLMDALSVPT